MCHILLCRRSSVSGSFVSGDGHPLWLSFSLLVFSAFHRKQILLSKYSVSQQNVLPLKLDVLSIHTILCALWSRPNVVASVIQHILSLHELSMTLIFSPDGEKLRRESLTGRRF